MDHYELLRSIVNGFMSQYRRVSVDNSSATSDCVSDRASVVELATPDSPGFTGQNGPLTGVPRSRIVFSMLINDRDRQFVLSVGRFGQLSPSHLAALHFHDLASATPMYRAIERLLERGYIKRIERRPVGGAWAGSGQFVYQLGSAGWALVGREGKYWPFRMVNHHTLAIADAYVELLKLERQGRLRIDGYSLEPDSWTVEAGADLRPDLHIEVSDIHRRRTIRLWIEIDMGTERQKAIKDKLARYWHAAQFGSDELREHFPIVLFIAPDDARASELRWIIKRGNQDAQELFMVSTMPEFAGLLFA